MYNYQMGSVWQRWDLHLHTPSSPDYDDNSVTNADIIASLKRHNISLVAITDHETMDVPRIIDLKKLANGQLTVLPGIELKSNLGGSEAIHFIGIFPDLDEFELTNLWTKISGK